MASFVLVWRTDWGRAVQRVRERLGLPAQGLVGEDGKWEDLPHGGNEDDGDRSMSGSGSETEGEDGGEGRYGDREVGGERRGGSRERDPESERLLSMAQQYGATG